MSKRPVVLAGGKRRTIYCGCGSVMSFYQKRDIESWCRRHARKCIYMKENFHKYTDIDWVETKHVNKTKNPAFKTFDWERTAIVKNDLVDPVQDLIGSVNEMSILGPVQRFVSEGSHSTLSSMSEPTPRMASAGGGGRLFPAQIDMIQSEVNYINIFFVCIN